MNDWITRYMPWFWLACLAVGLFAGMWMMDPPYGPVAGLLSGFAAAVILTFSRYIAAGDE